MEGVRAGAQHDDLPAAMAMASCPMTQACSKREEMLGEELKSAAVRQQTGDDPATHELCASLPDEVVNGNDSLALITVTSSPRPENVCSNATALGIDELADGVSQASASGCRKKKLRLSIT